MGGLSQAALGALLELYPPLLFLTHDMVNCFSSFFLRSGDTYDQICKYEDGKSGIFHLLFGG